LAAFPIIFVLLMSSFALPFETGRSSSGRPSFLGMLMLVMYEISDESQHGKDV